jgi:hypothetical protein
MTPDPSKFALIRGSEWEALYVDGESVDQGHSFAATELLMLAEMYGFKHSTLAVLWASTADDDKCLEEGNFPQYLSEFQSCNP